MWHQGCFFVPNRFGWMIKGPRWVVLKHVYEAMIAYYPWNPLSISSSRSFIHVFSCTTTKRWHEPCKDGFRQLRRGENMRKLPNIWWRYMKMPCQGFCWLLQKKSHILPCSNAFINCFILQMSNLRVPWTLKNEPRSPMFECLRRPPQPKPL